jgi:hypothetical protein
LEVARLISDQEDFSFSAFVDVGVVGAIEISLGWDVFGQGVKGGKPSIVFSLVHEGLTVGVIRHGWLKLVYYERSLYKEVIVS